MCDSDEHVIIPEGNFTMMEYGTASQQCAFVVTIGVVPNPAGVGRIINFVRFTDPVDNLYLHADVTGLTVSNSPTFHNCSLRKTFSLEHTGSRHFYHLVWYCKRIFAKYRLPIGSETLSENQGF